MTLFDFSIRYVDAYGRNTRRSAQVESIDFATAGDVVSDLCDAIDAMIDVGIVSYRVWQDFNYTTTVAAASNIDAGVTCVFELNVLGSGKKASQKIPGPKAVIITGSGELDLANLAVIAYSTEMLGGSIKISDGELPVALLSGKLDK